MLVVRIGKGWPVGICVGVDIGGTKIAAVAVDAAGRLLHRVRTDTPRQDAPSLVDAITQSVREVERALATGDIHNAPGQPEPGQIVGVGVACAGFIGEAGSTVVFAPNLPLRHEPLKARLEDALGLPVHLENDANAAAWAEYRYGAGRGAEGMLLVALGTGIGGGIITAGRLLRGEHGMAAEIGHMRVVPDGHLCGCGNTGCFEAYASGTALERRARELISGDEARADVLRQRCGGDPRALRGPMVTSAALAGDPASIELLQEIGRWTGMGIASLVAILDPELIVLGGGLSAADELLVEPARAAFAAELTGRGYRRAAPIVVAELGNDAGMIGAAALAAQAFAQPVPDRR